MSWKRVGHEAFLDRVVRRGGFRSPAEAGVAVRAVLTVLGEALRAADAEAVAAELPRELRDAIRARTPGAALTAGDFYDRVAAGEATPGGFAREHTGVVLGALAEELSRYALGRLAAGLPAGMAALLERRSIAPAPPPAHHAHARTTLASGRPGSQHPLSEAHPDRAQGESVARAANPHEDTKLSSSTGFTQERLDDSLATARPPSPRPLSEGES
jgi:uncharacterized protein (DUF2267 family)